MIRLDNFFESTDLRLTAIRPEADAPIEARWTHEARYLWALGGNFIFPQPPSRLKKFYEQLEKDMDEKRLVHFMLRLRADDSLLGFARLEWLELQHGKALLRLAIGDPAQRGRGYGSQAINLILRYAFDELNLYRVGLSLPNDDTRAIRFVERTGFQLEVRQRAALYLNGQRYDNLRYGLLAQEYLARNPRPAMEIPQ